MKIRNNYVSNSSSTSFIVEYKDNKQTIKIAGSEFSIQDFFDTINSFCNSSYISSTEMYEVGIDREDKENILKYLNNYNLEYFEDRDKENISELKNDIEKNLENHEKNFARFELSYHNKALWFLLNLFCKYELFKIRNKTEC